MTTSLAPGWRSYVSGRMLAVLVLGFSSGLPLFILLYLLQAWLAKSGLNVKALGLFALVQFPYIWKFLWAPLMDRYRILGLGRRRGWMALTQVALFFSIGAMGMLDPLTQIGLIAAAAGGVAFLSASQDIVIDAYRREILTATCAVILAIYPSFPCTAPPVRPARSARKPSSASWNGSCRTCWN
jgi:PAT family beta-lactamase induction signal transducer AmpG